MTAFYCRYCDEETPFEDLRRCAVCADWTCVRCLKTADSAKHHGERHDAYKARHGPLRHDELARPFRCNDCELLPGEPRTAERKPTRREPERRRSRLEAELDEHGADCLEH